MDTGGAGKPHYAQLHVCWAQDGAEARHTTYDWWRAPTGLEGGLNSELTLPRYFAQAAAPVREQDLAEKIVLGPDPEQHIAGIQRFVDAGFDHVFIHQIGPDQGGFFRFYEREVLPTFQTGG